MAKTARNIILLILIPATALCLFAFQGKNKNHMIHKRLSYNTVIVYKEGEKLDFTDFTLEFKGAKVTKTEMRYFYHYQFLINSGSSEKTIEWSPGTGDIAPRSFEVDGKRYELELQFSEKLKKPLAKDELIIVN